ncbi:hypothetical protein KZJ38_26315 [Paraburkholderia edwinii]|uniref:Uncharacterized protein n=1 Tax=Paraburkholderia edwinii TaxID=2861782 RepID=A0ABX8UW22_9BURK|nr:hypothetical protein [Paraburkholderia edwinii]QYD73169.1 hypothetical protein KZJ38_26315 [Paraburkholderia edwinii]
MDSGALGVRETFQAKDAADSSDAMIIPQTSVADDHAGKSLIHMQLFAQMGKVMSIQQGKTGVIHGVEVKARSQTQAPTVKVDTTTPDGREAILKAAEAVYKQHQSVIRALANR